MQTNKQQYHQCCQRTQSIINFFPIRHCKLYIFFIEPLFRVGGAALTLMINEVFNVCMKEEKVIKNINVETIEEKEIVFSEMNKYVNSPLYSSIIMNHIYLFFCIIYVHCLTIFLFTNILNNMIFIKRKSRSIKSIPKHSLYSLIALKYIGKMHI